MFLLLVLPSVERWANIQFGRPLSECKKKKQRKAGGIGRLWAWDLVAEKREKQIKINFSNIAILVQRAVGREDDILDQRHITSYPFTKVLLLTLSCSEDTPSEPFFFLFNDIHRHTHTCNIVHLSLPHLHMDYKREKCSIIYFRF